METESRNSGGGSDSAHQLRPEQPRRKWFRRAIVTAVIVCAILVGLPEVISKTPLRNAVLQSLVGDSNLSVSCRDAEFDWFSPLRIDDFRLTSTEGNVKIDVKQVLAEKSCLALWLSHPDLGKIEVLSPKIEIVVTDEETPSPDDTPHVEQWPRMSAVIKDGALLVREEGTEPVIDVQQVDIGFRIEQQSTGAVLVVDPVEVARHATLTPEQCEQGLQLVMPGLSDEVSLEGEYSFELTKIQLPLDSRESAIISAATQIEGRVTLHKVTTGLKNEVTYRLVLVAAELTELGDVPRQIRLAENSELTFRFEKGRVYHEGMAFVLPEVAADFSLRTRGSVGLDESIDLQCLIQIPLSAVEDSPLARQLSETPIEVRVTGTIDEPKIGLPAEQQWVSGMSDRLTSPDLSKVEQELADTIIDLLGDLVDDTAGPLPELPAPVMDRVRSETTEKE